MARVSVVMAVYNAATYLREAVDSVLRQTFHDLELIVVNDASTDASAEILAAYDDSRIRVVAHVTNMGAAVSRNVGLRWATGEYVAIMDADDVSIESRLAIQVEFLDSHPDIALVGCAIYDNIDDRGATLYTSYLPVDNDTIQKTLVERWCFLHPSVMVRREVCERVGGYRKEFEVAEDHDFILRVLDEYQAYNLPVKLVRYRVNPRGLSVTAHECIDGFGEAAMRLARARREGREEDLATELSALWEIQRNRAATGMVGRVVARWRDSYYASGRFYGFGCRELYGGNLKEARRCFSLSLKANCLFMKAWLCWGLSFAPWLVDRVRFAFVESARQGKRPAAHSV